MGHWLSLWLLCCLPSWCLGGSSSQGEESHNTAWSSKRLTCQQGKCNNKSYPLLEAVWPCLLIKEEHSWFPTKRFWLIPSLQQAWDFWFCFICSRSRCCFSVKNLIKLSSIYEVLKTSAHILVHTGRFINSWALAVAISAKSFWNKSLWFEAKRTNQWYLEGSGHRE